MSYFKILFMIFFESETYYEMNYSLCLKKLEYLTILADNAIGASYCVLLIDKP